jgi:hypothetical protein
VKEVLILKKIPEGLMSYARCSGCYYETDGIDCSDRDCYGIIFIEGSIIKDNIEDEDLE